VSRRRRVRERRRRSEIDRGGRDEERVQERGRVRAPPTPPRIKFRPSMSPDSG
jgi:hypothetical protein